MEPNKCEAEFNFKLYMEQSKDYHQDIINKILSRAK